MSHPNTERDERDERDKRAPKRIFIVPTRWGTLTVTERPTEQGRRYFEYIRADTTATAMRDLCVAKVRAARERWQLIAESTDEDLKSFAHVQAADDIIEELESLTLEQGEQEKSK